jgi:hypothetical protein
MLTARTIAALAAVLLAACNGAAPSLEPTPAPTPTAVPGIGGGNIGNPVGAPPPGGIVDPGGGLDPILGQAQLVTATAGLVNQHPVSVQLVRASTGASGVTAELRWWSGVAPCSALDSVQIAKDDAAKSIKLTVIEGSGEGDVACIDIAQLKATTIDLGKLAAGTWRISAEGDAPAITLEVG